MKNGCITENRVSTIIGSKGISITELYHIKMITYNMNMYAYENKVCMYEVSIICMNILSIDILRYVSIKVSMYV